jgi:chorismate dehydratase
MCGFRQKSQRFPGKEGARLSNAAFLRLSHRIYNRRAQKLKAQTTQVAIMNRRLRIGAVSYLNTKPLVYRLDELAPSADVCFDLPSRLADRLARRDLDIALIPAIEYFRNDDYTVVSDACIACRGPVLSVKLFAQVPPAEIRTLALDEGSRTSAAMVQILLNEHFGIRPELSSLSIGDGLSHATTDAVLLIGDRAIHAVDDHFKEVWDLGDAWVRRTDLPFVFAMWTARSGLDMTAAEWSQIDSALSLARDAGMSHLSEIAESESAAVGMTCEATLAYLRDNLYFRMGPRERQGLKRYYEDASALGLAPTGRELKFYDCQTT